MHTRKTQQVKRSFTEQTVSLTTDTNKLFCPACRRDLRAVFGKKQQVIFCRGGITYVVDHVVCACGTPVRYNYAPCAGAGATVITPWDDTAAEDLH